MTVFENLDSNLSNVCALQKKLGTINCFERVFCQTEKFFCNNSVVHFELWVSDHGCAGTTTTTNSVNFKRENADKSAQRPHDNYGLRNTCVYKNDSRTLRAEWAAPDSVALLFLIAQLQRRRTRQARKGAQSPKQKAIDISKLILNCETEKSQNVKC